MSGVVGVGTQVFSISGQVYGSLTPIVENAALTAQELAKLNEQASSGLVAQTYSGLGASAANTVLTVSPQISAANAQISEINAVTGPMTTQQNAMTEISSIASGVASQLSSFTLGSSADSSASTVIAAAKSALQEVAGLLDTQDGEDYVFGGQDSGEAPVPDAGNITSSGFFTQIQSAVANLSSNGAATTFASVLNIGSSKASGTSPFAAGLESSTGLPGVTLDNGEQVTTGIAANSNAYVTSTGTGTTSTGSYMRDILTALSSIAALSPSQASGSNFESFLDSVSTSLSNATDTLNDDAGVLGNNQTELSNVSTSLSSTVTALTNQVSNADSVDTAATLTQLSAVQTSLQSSYQLIAGMKTLNLAYYL
jgi:flagellar hook-associated protein 3 FlgL